MNKSVEQLNKAYNRIRRDIDSGFSDITITPETAIETPDTKTYTIQLTKKARVFKVEPYIVAGISSVGQAKF